MARLISLTTTEQRLLSIEDATMDGKPVRLDGTPTYTVKSGDCTIVPIDEKHAMLLAGDHIGQSEILFEASMDTGTGVHPVQELLVVQVHGEYAAHVHWTIGEAEAKPKKAQRSMFTGADAPTDTPPAEPETTTEPGTPTETGTTRRRG